MFFYPFFYGIGVIPLASLLPAQDISVQSATCIVVLFFSGWILTRGANLQKFMFRISGNNARFLCIRQETIVNTRILVSGFWGLSRHINYLGEIVQAIGLSLPALLAVSLPESLLSMQGLTYVYPILYPLFYIGLFIPRQADDDQLCLRKYGESWKEYQRRVPYRIVPYVW
jgi:delta14-sterol reductase